jgi:POT family proton-dependent oligopeptide transporter
VKKISWSWGFGLAEFYVLRNVAIYFLFFGDVGLKPTLASKQESKDKAAKLNLANIVAIIAVLIFYFYSFLLGIV